jgi:cell division protein FtsZ
MISVYENLPKRNKFIYLYIIKITQGHNSCDLRLKEGEIMGSFEEEQFEIGTANIKVIGVGGAGTNMVNWLYHRGVQGAEIIACNTDQLHLGTVSADRKFLIGKNLTRGLGCGGFPEKGTEAAKETINEIKDSLKRADMVFVCAGMGGGTGTGAAPVIAKVAKENGAIVIGTVTMPFKIERARVDKAEFGLQQLRQVSDTVIVIDNNRLVQIAGNLPVTQAFAVANELISTMLRGIVETIAVPSLVNLDYADVKAIMTNGGVAAIGVGVSDTNNRVQEAVNGALSNPLLEINYDGAEGALIHIEGGPDMTLDEVAQIGDLVTEKFDADANVIWGARVSDQMKGKICVMTIITGVQSPWILGKNLQKDKVSQKASYEDMLGIELL